MGNALRVGVVQFEAGKEREREEGREGGREGEREREEKRVVSSDDGPRALNISLRTSYTFVYKYYSSTSFLCHSRCSIHFKFSVPKIPQKGAWGRASEKKPRDSRAAPVLR
jgi:hypothetical protein